MIRASVLLAALALALMPAAGLAQTEAELIERAVLPLPPALRDGARVVTYAARGQPAVLRQGSNEMYCRLLAYLPIYFAQCHHRDLTAMFDRYYELRGGGTSDDEAALVLDAEIEAGELSVNNGGTEYLMTGASPEAAELIITVTIPGATGASTGLPTEEVGDQPWLMWAGTQVAHVMIPQE